MNVVDTPSPKKDRFVLRPDGTIDFQAYIGLEATFPVGQINVLVKIIGARTRYGHLDLNITPAAGEGTRWIEYKNLMIHNDPIKAHTISLLNAAAEAALTCTTPTFINSVIDNDQKVSEIL